MKRSLTIIAYVFSVLVPSYWGLLNSRDTLWVQTSVLRHFILQPPAGVWLVIFFAAVAAIAHIWLNNLPTPLKMLEKELSRQLGEIGTQITVMQGHMELIQKVEEPSPRARKLAAQIPSDADPYALALKAIAEKRFDNARELLSEAQKIKEVDLSIIYGARGQTEIFAIRYTDAINWYQKALALRQDDPSLLNQTALAFYFAGKYAEAEPLFRRSLEIWEKALDKEHPNVAASLNNLAEIYRTQGKYGEAEPLYRRSLEIREKALGKEHPDVAASLDNLAALYFSQGKYAEAEPLFRRSLEIREKALDKEHPNVAASLNNLAELYRAQGKYAEAEPLYRGSLEIREKALGKEHPDVAASLNNLAALYEAQGKYAEAEPLYRRSLEIWEKALGKEHPKVVLVRSNLARLLEKQNPE